MSIDRSQDEAWYADLRLGLPATFVEDDGTIVVNFGILTGREATQAEIDRLARVLVTEGGADPDLTILSARRQDYGEGIETVTHQVLVHASGGAPVSLEVLCRAWALRCADDWHIEPLRF
jgi:hypothetical protein